MLAKKIAFFAALLVAVFLTWFVMDTVSDIPAMKAAASVQTKEEGLLKLTEKQNKECVSDSDCMMVPATCSSCNCRFESIAVKGAESYITARTELCKDELGAMKATCDLYCPMKPVCKNQKCTIETPKPTTGQTE